MRPRFVPRGAPAVDRYILALDQGTTSSRALVVDQRGAILSTAQREFTQILPTPGHVEHDPEEIWQTAAHGRPRSARAGWASKPGSSPPSASPTSARPPSFGSAPTAAPWPTPSSGRAASPRRSAIGSMPNGLEPLFREKTGLVIDAYFSATQDQASARHRAGPAARGRGRRHPVRHGRFVSHLAAHRRRARHRRQQRQPHAAVQHPHARLGRRAAADLRACRAAMLPEVPPLERGRMAT